MSNIKDIKKRAKAAGQRVNQNETKKGGGDFQAPAEGKTTMRLLEYIELGVQAGGMFKGKPKKPTAKVQIAFELLGKKHLREIENEKTKKTEVRGTYFRIFPNLALSLHEKAAFKKLYNLLRNSYANPEEITHMSQLLGEAFAGKIRNNVSGDKTYSNLTNEDGTFAIGAPVREELDEEGEVVSVKKLAVPDLTMTPKLFLFDDPTKEDWESLDEKTQERIKKAENYKGSAVELLVDGGDNIKTHEDEDDEDADEAEDTEADEDDEDEAPKKAAKPASKAKAPSKKVVDEDEDEEEDADEDDAEEEDVADEDDEEEEVAPKKAAKKPAPAKAASKKSAPASSGKKASSAASAKTASPSKGKKVSAEVEDLIDQEDDE